MRSASPHVEITENGRSGSVRYSDVDGTVNFYWEFGGGDVVVIVQVSNASWKDASLWTTAKRREVLRFVADELIRQKAPGCIAEINEEEGSILLKQAVGQAPPAFAKPPRQFSPSTYRSLRTKLALVVLVVTGFIAGVLWFKNKVLAINSGKGTPMGLSVRTDTHIATLIETMEPHLPTLDGRGGDDRYSISIQLVPLDGSKPKLIPILHGMEGNSYSLAKVLGSDGSTLWFDVNGTGGVDLRSYDLLEPAAIRDDPPKNLQGALAWPFPLRPDAFICAGFFTGPNTWLGLHSPAEAEKQFAPKRWLRHVEIAEDAKQLRRFHRGVLDPDSSDGRHRIVSMTPIDDTEYLNAAFLRLDDRSEPYRLHDPDGALMIWNSEPGLKGRVMVARVDTDGNIRWKADTGIDRFHLSQILPDEKSMAFVGQRPPVPDQLSEPLLVIVDNSTGEMRTYSLWE